MNVAHFYALFLFLELISPNYCVKDMCATTDHRIESVRIENEGQNHCLFQLPNDSKILHRYPGGYCFDMDEVRRECAKYEAGLLTFPNKEFVKRVNESYGNITAQFKKSGVYYLLGVKELMSHYAPMAASTRSYMVECQWDSGFSMRHPLNFHQPAFKTKTWIIKQATEDAIAYLSVPCLGSNTSSMPTIYTYSPSLHNQIYPVFILCSQELSTETKDRFVCTNENIRDRMATIVTVGRNVTCIFRPINESDAVNKSDTDQGCTGCYHVNMTAARAICKSYSAVLLQITNEGMFDAVVEASRILLKEVQGTVVHPLGVRHKLVEADFHLSIPTYNITWDNEMTASGQNIFDVQTYTYATDGVLFYEATLGYFDVLNPAGISKPLAVVCHQDPQHPVSSPTQSHSSPTQSHFVTIDASRHPETQPATIPKTMDPHAAASTTSCATSSRDFIDYLNIIEIVLLAIFARLHLHK